MPNYMYMCGKCKGTYRNDNNNPDEKGFCPECGGALIGMHITGDGWAALPSEDRETIKSLVLAAKNPSNNKNIFCMKCGNQMPEGSKFCIKCGAQIGIIQKEVPREISTKETQASQEPEKMYKCPNCASSISRMDAVCPYCGAQVANRVVANSVQKFAEELARIENEAPAESGNNGLMGALGLNKALEKGFGTKSFNQKINLIKTFPIPNTVEEISEFLLLASSNIDVRFGKDTLYNKMAGNPGGGYYSDVTLAKTWIGKMEQAYNKAKLSFSSDPIFPKIEKIYKNKMHELGKTV